MNDSGPGNLISDLSLFSAKIGSDPLQVQAAGGNTSIKHGDMMWIKASGTCLADACNTDLFVPLHLTALLDALAESDPRTEKSVDFVIQEHNPDQLRPSIETTVHAVLPQKVVVHVHCVDTIAVAIQTNAEALFGDLLAGFNWLWVPYRRPGLPLSKYISKAMSPGTDVIILGNHGLVVAADSVELAEELLIRVRKAVKQPIHRTPAADITALTDMALDSDYIPAEDQATHAVAMDSHTLSIAASGSLYPDHVIFLGDGTAIASSGTPISQLAEKNNTDQNPLPKSLVVPNKGVLMHQTANTSQHAMARCLSDVCVRVPEHSSINYLTSKDVHDLLNWEAETYRQSLANE